MESSAVIEELWRRIQARDWAGAGELVAPGAVVEWPATKERITGRDNYIAVNSQYPEGWQINVLRIVADGDQVVSEVEVPHAELGVFRVASFWTVTGGQVAGGTEYWITVGGDQPEDWRVSLTERM
jgi:ketosteroid isomerase-like protein